jgi:hypothetical protein
MDGLHGFPSLKRTWGSVFTRMPETFLNGIRVDTEIMK